MENIAEFNEAIDVGIRQSQMEGIRYYSNYTMYTLILCYILAKYAITNTYRIVNKFLDSEQANKDSLEQLHEQVSGENDDELNDDRIASINQSINAVIDEFTTLLDEAWYNLMDLEMSSHERIEEANASFAHAIQDMLHEFVENAQLHFVEISEAEIEFSDRLHELVSNWLSKRAASDVNDQGMKKVAGDRSMNFPNNTGTKLLKRGICFPIPVSNGERSTIAQNCHQPRVPESSNW